MRGKPQILKPGHCAGFFAYGAALACIQTVNVRRKSPRRGVALVWHAYNRTEPDDLGFVECKEFELKKADGKAEIRSLWRRKRTWLIAVAGLLAAASLWMRSYNEAGSGDVARTQIGDFKSQQDMSLFPVPLLAAARKFPGYAECVELGENGNLQPKWEAMTSQAQVEVCVYRIADQLSSIEATRSYFEDIGMRSSRIDDSSSETRVEINCPLRSQPCRLPAVPMYLFGIFPVEPIYVISISYRNSELVDVTLHFELV